MAQPSSEGVAGGLGLGLVTPAHEADIDEKYKSARKLILTLQHQLEQLETGADTSVFMQGKIATNLNTLARINDTLQSMKKALPNTKREIWNMKVKQLQEDEKQVRSAMERFLLHIHTKAQQENDLIRRKQGLAANPYNPNASMNEQRLYRDGVSLQSSNRLVSELREVGVGVIEKLRAQNSTIKGAQRRLLDIANTIGLSRAVMRLIERRQWQDQILVYSGMAFVLILFFVLVYLFRW